MKSCQKIRSELLDVLSELSRVRPQWRLGQTLANLATTAGRMDSGGVWDLEDEEALEAARTLIQQYSERKPDDAEEGAGPEMLRRAGSAPGKE
jgi:hypothetical protein